MALDRPYTTVALVRAEIRNDEASILSTLEDAINLASRYVEDYTGRDFLYHDHSTVPFKIRLTGPFIFLPWPVITLTEIVFKGAAMDLTNAVSQGRMIDLSDVVLIDEADEANEGLRYENSIVSVKGTFGYPLAQSNPTTTPPTGLPSPIARATTLIAAAWSGLYTIERAGLDGQRVSISSTEIPKDAERFLSRYKVVVV